MNREAFPAPLGVALALRVMVHRTETDQQHRLEARLLAEDGEMVGRVEIGFGIVEPGDVRPGEELSVVFPVPLQQVQLAHAGAYSFELLIDGIHQRSVPFVAEQVRRASE